MPDAVHGVPLSLGEGRSGTRTENGIKFIGIVLDDRRQPRKKASKYIPGSRVVGIVALTLDC